MRGQKNAAAGGLIADECRSARRTRASLPAAHDEERGRKVLAADAAVSRRTAATGASGGVQESGKESDGGTSDAQARRKRFSRRCWHHAPPRVVAVPRREVLMLGPSVVSRDVPGLSQRCFWCRRALQSNSRPPCGRPVGTRAENTQIYKSAWDARGKTEMHEDREELGKSLPPHASEVRNQTLLLMVTAGGTSGRVKNTQRSPAGNSRMNEERHAAFGEHESRAKLCETWIGKLLTCRTNSGVREPNGRYRKKPYRGNAYCRTIVVQQLKFQLLSAAFLTKQLTMQRIFCSLREGNPRPQAARKSVRTAHCCQYVVLHK